MAGGLLDFLSSLSVVDSGLLLGSEPAGGGCRSAGAGRTGAGGYIGRAVYQGRFLALGRDDPILNLRAAEAAWTRGHAAAIPDTASGNTNHPSHQLARVG